MVSALRSKQGASNKVLRLVALGSLSLSVSVAAVLEYEDVLLRPGMVPGFNPSEIQQFLHNICAVARHQEIFFTWRPTLSDPDDEIFLELAVAASASHLITHNKRDFEAAQSFGLRVLTPAELLQEI
jgi:predicted nucleic acid-binding protein